MSRRPAIAIDFGTTYSRVAVWIGDEGHIITNDQGNRSTPSYVAFTSTGTIVGDAAKSQAARNPLNTVFGALRIIGRKYVLTCSVCGMGMLMAM